MPIRRLDLHRERDYGSVVAATLGTALPSLTVTASQLGGFFAAAFRPPLDMDHSRVARLFVGLYCPSGAPVATADVELVHVVTTAGDGTLAGNTTYTDLRSCPGNWTLNELAYVELFNAGEPAFAAHYFNPLFLYGIRIVRNGPSASDTYARSTSFTTTPWIEYSENCRYACL